VAAAAGAQLTDAVRVGIYVTDISTFRDVNEAYGAYFESDPPARSTIGVAALPLGAEVEIDMVLALPD
jgi:2-iminobutanoate/2-iminopropanoate deaminase